MSDADEQQRMALAFKGALRDANPLLGTLEDVGNVLGQTGDEGLLDAARRVADRLRALELDALGRRGHDVATPQPAPVAGTGDVWAEVIADERHPTLRQIWEGRRAFGLEKYGTPLQRENGRDHRADLLQELGDAVVYARAAGECDVETMCRDAVLRLIAKEEIGAWERDVTGGPVLPDTNETPYQRAKRARGEAMVAHYRTGEALRLTEEAMRDAPLTEEEAAEREAGTLAWLGSLPGSAEPASPADELDPVAAVERVTGEKFGGTSEVWEIYYADGNVVDGWMDDAGRDKTFGRHGWDIDATGEHGPETGAAGKRAASLAFLRAIHAGTVTLPDSCPGLAVLTPAERAAFLEVPHV